jgi:hypothetical protein
MAPTFKKLDFHNDSRKPFAEESYVIEAVEQARKRVGVIQGSALFRGSSYASAAPTVIPRALDIIRDGMGTAVEQAMAQGYAQTVVENAVKDSTRRSRIARGDYGVSDSLERLGFTNR